MSYNQASSLLVLLMDWDFKIVLRASLLLILSKQSTDREVFQLIYPVVWAATPSVLVSKQFTCIFFFLWGKKIQIQTHKRYLITFWAQAFTYILITCHKPCYSLIVLHLGLTEVKRTTPQNLIIFIFPLSQQNSWNHKNKKTNFKNFVFIYH